MAEGVTRLVVGPDAGLGDIILMLPAVDELTKSGPLYLVLFNHLIRPLIPWSDLIRHPGDMRDPWQCMDNIALSIHICVGKWGKTDHPTRLYYKQAELPMPDGVPQPRIVMAGDGPVYDFVFAPWSHEPDRSLTPEQAHDILMGLRARYPNDSIAVLGSPDSPEVPHIEAHWGGTLMRHYGMDFRDVAHMIQVARKGVITVDSFPNRLAHATGTDKHVLLCAATVPEVWGGHPKVRMLYGRDTWTLDNIIRKIEQ